MATNISNLTPAEIAAMTTAQIAALTASEWAAFSIDQIGALTADQVVAIPATRLGGLTATQVGAFDPTDFSVMSSTQLRSISTSGISAMTSNDFDALTAPQLNALTTSQVRAIVTAELAGLSAQTVSTLTTTQISALSTVQVDNLSVNQIQALTTAQVRGLNTQQVASLSTEDLTSLTQDQFSSLTSRQLGTLSGAQAGALDSAYVAALSTQQLRSLSTGAVAGLDSSDFGALGSAQIGALSTGQMRAISTAALAALSGESVALFNTTQTAALTSAQLASLTTTQLAGLLPAQITSLGSAQLAALSTEQLNSLSSSQFQALTSAQIAALSTDQVVNLETEDLAALSAIQVRGLSAAALAAMDSADLAALGTQQLAGLSTVQLRALEAGDLAGLSTAAVAALSSVQINGLTTAQLAALSSEQLQALTASQLRGLGSAQIASLSTNNLNALASLNVRENGGDHMAENRFSDGGADEVEHQDVVSNAVEDLGAIENDFEVALDLPADAGRDLCVGLIRGDVGHPPAVGLEAIDAEVGREDDEGFGEVDTVAAARGEHAVVEDLQKFVEDPRVCFFDLIKKDHGEGFFADGVGQLASHVVADITRRGSDQALVGVFGGKFRHVEADIGLVVAKKQPGQGFGQLGFAHPGGTREEGDAAGPVAAPGCPHAGDGPFDDIEQMHHRRLLAAHSFANVGIPFADFVAVDFRPGIVLDSNLVAPNRFPDAGQVEAFGAAQLGDRFEVGEQKAFGLFDQLIAGRFEKVRRCLGIGENPQQVDGQGAPCPVIRTRDRDVPDAGIADQQPGGKFPFVVDEPKDGVEEGLRGSAKRTGFGLMRKDQGPAERLVFGRGQGVRAYGEPGGKVDHQCQRRVSGRPLDESLQDFGKKFEVRRGCLGLAGPQPQSDQGPLAGVRRIARLVEDPESLEQVINENLGITPLAQLEGQGTEQGPGDQGAR